MNAGTAIRAVAAAAAGRPVVFAAGGPALLARRGAHRTNHIYLDGSSGLASSVGIGVALHTRHTTVVVDEPDGLLVNLAALVTAGMLTDLPLVHVVLDGYAHDGRADLCGLASAVGYLRTYTVERTEGLANLVRGETAHCPSPVFVRCLLAGGTSPAVAGTIRGGSRRRSERDNPLAWVTEAA